MSESFADVTIHVDETLDHVQLHSVAQSLREQKGISSVEASDARPHLMVVKYDPGQINSQLIHQTIVDQGYHAELLGL